MFAEWMNIFFRLLNFAILIGLLAYLFKRFVYPSFTEQMAARAAAEHALENERAVLGERQSALDTELIQQDAVHKELVEKIQAWRTTVERTWQHKQQEKQTITEKLIKKMDQRRAYCALNTIEQKVTPEVVEQLRLQLTQTFALPEKGALYIQDVVNHLERTP